MVEEKKEKQEVKIGWKVENNILTAIMSLGDVFQANWLCDDIKQYLRDIVQITKAKKAAAEQAVKAKLEGRDNISRGLKNNKDFLKGKMK